MKRLEKSNSEDDTIEMLVDQSCLSKPLSCEVRVDLAASTHRGHVRANNEDHYLAVRFGRSLETLFTNLAEGLIEPSYDETGYGMVVADGLGGMAAGEIASRTALCRLLELVVNTPDWIMKVNRSDDVSVVARRMTQRFRQIDETLREQVQRDFTLAGMGTTLTSIVTLGADALVAHIGDSRAYLLRDNELQQLTQDHTMAQAMVDAGIAHPEDTATRAMRHVLTAALGSTGEPVEPQVQRLQISGNDQILLCTDGLTEVVKDDAIKCVLRNSKTASDGCQALVDLALSAGAPDNVTVVLARYDFANQAN